MRLQFEWDPVKSDATRKLRGFGFDDAARVFLDVNRIQQIDKRQDYGEARWQVIGSDGDDIYFVVYTFRQNYIRIISARKANGNEERIYRSSGDRGRWQATAGKH